MKKIHIRQNLGEFGGMGGMFWGKIVVEF